MNPDDYAANFLTALNVHDMGRLRTAQTDGGVLGASDAGQCRNKAVLTVRQTPPSNVPKKGRAQIGTFLHAGALEAVAALFPERIIEASLTATLPSGIQIPLHPDEIDPTEPSVTDLKFTADVALSRRMGASNAQKMQRSLQYLAAHQAGIVPAEGMVRNIFISMTDADDTFVDQEPFDMAWIEAADVWYQDVRYAVEHDEEGAKDWPYPMCESYCPFFTICRPPVPELSQRITNVELAQTALVAMEAREQRKHWVEVEKQAVERLKGVSGVSGDVQVVTTTVNAKAGPYNKVDLRRIT